MRNLRQNMERAELMKLIASDSKNPLGEVRFFIKTVFKFKGQLIRYVGLFLWVSLFYLIGKEFSSHQKIGYEMSKFCWPLVNSLLMLEVMKFFLKYDPDAEEQKLQWGPAKVLFVGVPIISIPQFIINVILDIGVKAHFADDDLMTLGMLGFLVVFIIGIGYLWTSTLPPIFLEKQFELGQTFAKSFKIGTRFLIIGAAYLIFMFVPIVFFMLGYLKPTDLTIMQFIESTAELVIKHKPFNAFWVFIQLLSLFFVPFLIARLNWLYLRN